MRDNKKLIDLMEEIKILCQYLYMEEGNSITVSNGICNLKLTMNDNGVILCANLNYPESATTDYRDMLNLESFEGIIEQLKEQKPIGKFSNVSRKYESRWEEIRMEVKMSTIKIPFNHNR